MNRPTYNDVNFHGRLSVFLQFVSRSMIRDADVIEISSLRAETKM